jgi:tetratricopeptide (TPR) repeat protein
MEDTPTPEPAGTGQPMVCANCGQPGIAGDHPTPLCSDCREKFTKFPIPIWIKLFAVAVVAVMLFSLYSLPANISLGIHLAKGRKAAEDRRYVTAERELKMFTDKVPGNTEARERLLVAAYYNEDYEAFSEQVGKLEHVKMDDDEAYRETDHVMSDAEVLVPSDSFKVFTGSHPALNDVPDTAWQNYFRSNPDDNSARIQYASLLFDQKDYSGCDSVMQSVLAAHPGNIPALMMEASAKRELEQYDSALAYNIRILAINRESVVGLASEARTLLRQKEDAKALGMALQSYGLNEKEPYAQASLILAYHFNGRADDRDALIKKAMQAVKDSSGRTTLQYALDVISKKEKFRD